MTDGFWYHGNGKIGGEFHPTKPNDEERYGEYVKIKHGHWVDVYDNNGHHQACSECGEWRYHNKQIYCGFCGAKMDEVEE